MNCCLKKCSENSLNSEMGRVEICIGRKIQKKNTNAIDWGRGGNAAFHKSCWATLLKAARSRNKKNHPLSISQSEKILLKEAAKTAEEHDSVTTLKDECAHILKLLNNSKHCVAFTGAGISTAAGIGDYRGKSGKWTEDDRKHLTEKMEASEVKDDEEIAEVEDDDEGVPYEDLRPTYTHEALYKLSQMGILKHVISQNGDGLHSLSGIPDSNLSELHGNVFLEKCEKCGKSYHRTYYVMDDTGSQYYEELEDYGKASVKKPKFAKKCDLCGLSHRTGRRCEEKGCSGYLMDSIINFRDHLEEAILTKAEEEASRCDLMLCLGTTLKVTPASDLVEMGQTPLKLVICNRQKTYMDKECVEIDPDMGRPRGSRIFGDCDKMMREVMKGLLSKEELREWEDGREERLKQYDTKRINAD